MHSDSHEITCCKNNSRISVYNTSERVGVLTDSEVLLMSLHCGVMTQKYIFRNGIKYYEFGGDVGKRNKLKDTKLILTYI